MVSRRGASVCLAVVLACALVGCAASTPSQSSAPAVRTPVASAPVFASPAEARAKILQLEDRRAFDAATLGAAARHTDPSVREHAALAAGRIGDDRGRELATGLLADPAPDVRA